MLIRYIANWGACIQLQQPPSYSVLPNLPPEACCISIGPRSERGLKLVTGELCCQWSWVGLINNEHIICVKSVRFPCRRQRLGLGSGPGIIAGFKLFSCSSLRALGLSFYRWRIFWRASLSVKRPKPLQLLLFNESLGAVIRSESKAINFKYTTKALRNVTNQSSD